MKTKTIRGRKFVWEGEAAEALGFPYVDAMRKALRSFRAEARAAGDYAAADVLDRMLDAPVGMLRVADVEAYCGWIADREAAEDSGV